MKNIFKILFVLILIFFGFNVIKSKENTNSIKKVISIVYDDSGSMSGNNNWEYASYSMQNLVGLMNDGDEIGVVKMSDPYNVVKLDLKNNRKNDIKSIYSWEAIGNTPFAAVDTAAKFLLNQKNLNNNSSNIEYWLIVITDGEFGMSSSEIELYLKDVKKRMGENKYDAVLVSIGTGSPESISAFENIPSHHVIKAKSNSSIIEAMMEVSSIILGQGSSNNLKINVDSSNKKIDFYSHFPLSKFIIYQQNQKVGVKSVTSSEEKFVVNGVFDTVKPGNKNIESKIIHVYSAKEYISAGNISIEFDSKINTSKNDLKILTIPAVKLELYVLDKNGNIIKNFEDVSVNKGDYVNFAGYISSSIDGSIIDLKSLKKHLNAELYINNKLVDFNYNENDNMFYGSYQMTESDYYVYGVVNLDGYFRAKSDVLNIIPGEFIVIDGSLDSNEIDVFYKYINDYEKVHSFNYTLSGTTINNDFVFKFNNIPEGITISINDNFLDKNNEVKIKLFNDVPLDISIHRNKNYKEVEKSIITFDIFDSMNNFKLSSNSDTKIILNPNKRKITVEGYQFNDNIDVLNFDNKKIYVLSILANGEYLDKDELNTLLINYSKINGIDLNTKIIKYNGRYAFEVTLTKKYPSLFIKTGNLVSDIIFKTLYDESNEVFKCSFLLGDNIFKYLFPFILFMFVIILVGYMPGIKKRIHNKKYHIIMNGNEEMIRVSLLSRIFPYVSERGVGSDLQLIASSSKNKIRVVNTFGLSNIYLDDEKIENNSTFDLYLDSKFKVVDGYTQCVYSYSNAANNLFNNNIDNFDVTDDIVTEEDYY